ncbi:MAG: UbiA family prenyltransferase [Lentisphaeria bacterium]|nr:UbiA family prenyltransferase [Lentisphaeria bacterium]
MSEIKTVSKEIHLSELFIASQIYPALGIASFSIAIWHSLGYETVLPGLIIFHATWLAYLFDSYSFDAADVINKPRRYSLSLKYHAVQEAIMFYCIISLIALPFIYHKPELLLVLIPCALLCLNYSKAIISKVRFKNLALIKPFIPAIAISTAIILLPGINGEMVFTPLFSCWILLLLFSNIFYCDIEDIDGDEITGLKTPAVYMGEKNAKTIYFCLSIAHIYLGFSNGYLWGCTSLILFVLTLIPSKENLKTDLFLFVPTLILLVY